MAKRKRNRGQSRKRNIKRASVKMTLQQREERVKMAMQHGHDKEAIVHLKQMLKQERRPEWVEWTLEAHQRQTHRLFQLGKFQETASLFESGHQLCGLSLDCAEYILCLLNLKQTTKAAERYVLAQFSLSKADLLTLRAKLGALALTGDRQIRTLLPADDPVVIDFDKALALLECWCANDDTGLRKALKALSFRSPYRDLRAVLSASLPDNGETGTNHERLERIPADSPYKRLATLIYTASLDNQQLLSSLAGLNSEERKFLMQLKGWSKEEASFVEKLAALPHEPDYAGVFRMADNYKAIDVQSMHDIALMAGIHGSAHHNRAVNLSRFEKRFGRLSKSEKTHAEARSLSFAYTHRLLEGGDYEFSDVQEVERAWIDYVEDLPEHDATDEARFRIALINRYVTNLWLETGHPLNEISIENFERSLEIDPQDKPTHLKVIDYYLGENKPKKARTAVNNALAVYPEDISMLLAAIKVAVAGNTFKKAAGYAKQILKVDPINIEARRLLHAAHLSHARKQVCAHKWHLVHKELNEAMRWSDEPFAKASGFVLEACYQQQTQHPKLAAKALNEASELAGSVINTCFIIQLEASNIDYNAADLYSLAGIDPPLDSLRHKDELFSLIDAVDHFLNKDNTDEIARLLSQFNTALEPSVNLIEVEDEFEKLCEFWLRTRQDSLLASYADAAARQFEDKPVFTYFRMINKPRLDLDEFEALENAIEEAREQGNQALAMRMISLLAEIPPPRGDMNAFMGMLGGDDYDDAPVTWGASYDDNEIINLIRTADMDEVLINMVSMTNIPHDEIEQVRAIIGDDALREFFLHAFAGGNIEGIQGLLPEDSRPPPKARRKKKKSSKKSTNTRQFGLFE
jgi:hypothetical protein